MEWNRGGSQPQPAGQSVGQAPAPNDKNKKGGLKFVKELKIVQVVLLFSIVVLIVAVAALVGLGGPKAEKSYVDKSKLQAVFLNGGQVYFGKIGDLNGKYLSMNNIYYLRVNQQVQPDQNQSSASNDISLVKLGCELHGPQDNMVINREQVIFWENLKEDGQVAKAVADYQKQNPNGQQCSENTGGGTNTDANSTNTGTGTGTGTNTGTDTNN